MNVVSNTGMEYKLLNWVTIIVEIYIKRVKPSEYYERELTPEDIDSIDKQYFHKTEIDSEI